MSEFNQDIVILSTKNTSLHVPEYVVHQCVHPECTSSCFVAFSHSLLPLSSCQQEEVSERPTRTAIQGAGVTETQGQLKAAKQERKPRFSLLFHPTTNLGRKSEHKI